MTDNSCIVSTTGTRYPRHVRAKGAFLIGIGFFAAAIAAPILAHGGRLPFLFWGGFPRPAADCQKVIGWAARVCAVDIVRLRAVCSAGSTAGPRCHPERITQRRQAILRQALDQINARCSDRATQQLGFVSLIEAQADISDACTSVELATLPVVAPTPTAPSATPRVDTCGDFVRHAALKLLRYSTAQWQLAFNRIAYRYQPSSIKLATVERVRARMERARAKLLGLESRFCTAEEVSTRFGVPLPALLQSVVRSSECLTGAAYVQDAVYCDKDHPAP